MTWLLIIVFALLTPLTGVFLAAFAVLVLYVIIVTVSPMGTCRRCHGKPLATRGGFRLCPKCKGRRKTYRPGAALIHRQWAEHLGPWLREHVRPVQGEGGDQ